VVDAYNCELRDSEGFIGDRASKRAFHAILEDWRERVRRAGEDPLGETPSDELGKKTLDKLLVSGEPEPAGLVQGAIEDFAPEFATVIRRFLRLKSWRVPARRSRSPPNRGRPSLGTKRRCRCWGTRGGAERVLRAPPPRA
jgi:hypothetical protein